jgi:hypothetical protein
VHWRLCARFGTTPIAGLNGVSRDNLVAGA